MNITPVIKWAGGKRQILSEIVKRMPKDYGTYYEPFFGGGALFFNIAPPNAIINDFNPQLANLYKQIKDNTEDFKILLSILEYEYNCFISMNSKDNYYKFRLHDYNNCLLSNEQSLDSAALLVFLNKSGFNGLYRMNSKGLYNVPSAHKEMLTLYDEMNVTNMSNSFDHTVILNCDFYQVCVNAKPKDFVFFDPPYYGTFDKYQANGFSYEDHIRLFELFDMLSRRNVYCMLTNSNTEFICNLYSKYNIDIIPVKRMINRDASNRVGEEVIITNYTI